MKEGISTYHLNNTNLKYNYCALQDPRRSGKTPGSVNDDPTINQPSWAGSDGVDNVSRKAGGSDHKRTSGNGNHINKPDKSNVFLILI